MQGMRLRLHVAFGGAGRKKRVAIVIQIADLAGNVLVQVLADYRRSRKPVANSRRGGSAGGNHAPVVVEAITDSATDLIGLLCQARAGRQQPRQNFQSHT